MADEERSRIDRIHEICLILVVPITHLWILIEFYSDYCQLIYLGTALL